MSAKDFTADKFAAAMRQPGLREITLTEEIAGYAQQTIAALGLGMPLDAFQPVLITNAMLKPGPHGQPMRTNAKAAGINSAFIPGLMN